MFCRTNFRISEDVHVILTQSEHGLYAYVCVIPMLFVSEVILLAYRFYFTPLVVQHIAMSVSVCLSTCICVQTSQNFQCVLTVSVAQSLSDNSATHYVLPVFWMTLS